MRCLDSSVVPSVQRILNVSAPVSAVDRLFFVSEDGSHEGVEDTGGVGVSPVGGWGGGEGKAGEGRDDDVERGGAGGVFRGGEGFYEGEEFKEGAGPPWRRRRGMASGDEDVWWMKWMLRFSMFVV